MDRHTLDKLMKDLELLQGLSKAYATIASARMQNTRQSVLSNRDFLYELDVIFKEVRANFRRQVKQMTKKRKGGGITFIPHNGKTASVLLSANTGLYGSVVPETFRLFAKEIIEKGTEATIVGKLGLSYYIQQFPNTPYTYFDFPDYGKNKEDLGLLIKHLVQYEDIHIFYGKFKSLVNQVPDVYNISAQNPFDTAGVDDKNIAKYLFEPSLEEILVFFETEMFTSLFEQAVSEGQLAKFASRMISMDRAGEKIKEELEKSKIQRMRLMHAESNKKIINTFASQTLWQ